MLSLPHLLGLIFLSLLAYGPVARLLGLDGGGGWPGTPPTPGGRAAAPPSRSHPRPRLNSSLLALEGPDDAAACPPDSYRLRVVSRRPLVMYVEDFVSPAERAHLLGLAEPLFEPSTVTDDGGARRDTSVRVSDVAMVERTPATRCVEGRARALQGWRDELWIERLRVQRYGVGGRYGHHFDWMDARHGYGRVSSMMVWLDDGGGSLVGGGTEFPLLRRPSGDARWCSFIECPEGNSGGNATADAPQQRQLGVVFKPVVGNAVYWENFPPGTVAGPGYDESWHAGLPVEAGVKVGLNIWSVGRID